jgi:hypothetical protein
MDLGTESDRARQPLGAHESEGHEEEKTSIRNSVAPPPLGTEPEECFQDALLEFEQEEDEPIDWENDPLESGRGSEEPTKWNHSFFSQFAPREHRKYVVVPFISRGVPPAAIHV